ncbi:hypothetical protein EI94DRAFT_1749061 [Lactarius quietus]|nr:hypothetical protein EI94DRAFT_1749061 [Lactarius quietus]
MNIAMRALLLLLLQVFLATACFATPSKRQGVPAGAVPFIPTGLGPQPTTNLAFVTLAVGMYNASCSDTSGTYMPVAALAQVFDISSLFDGPFFNNIQNLVYNNIWNPAASNDPLDPNVASQIQSKYALELLGELAYIYVSGGTPDRVLHFRQATETNVSDIPQGPVVNQSPVATTHGPVVTQVPVKAQDPMLDFRQATGNPNYIFVGKIVADIPSSDDPTTDADWQRWDATSGSGGLANSVYLIDTLGGQLNSVDTESCDPSNPGLLSKFVGVCWGFK